MEVRTIPDEERAQLQYIYAGIDFGFAVDPAVFILTAYDSKHDTVYLLDEIYEKHCSNKDLADKIRSGFRQIGEIGFGNGEYIEVKVAAGFIIYDIRRGVYERRGAADPSGVCDGDFGGGHIGIIA